MCKPAWRDTPEQRSIRCRSTQPGTTQVEPTWLAVLRPPETMGRGGAGLIACGTTVSIRATVIFPDRGPDMCVADAVCSQSSSGIGWDLVRLSLRSLGCSGRLTLTQPASHRDVCPGVRPYSVMGALDPFKIADGGQYSVGLRNSMLVPLLVGWWVDPSTLCPTGW